MKYSILEYVADYVKEYEEFTLKDLMSLVNVRNADIKDTQIMSSVAELKRRGMIESTIRHPHFGQQQVYKVLTKEVPKFFPRKKKLPPSTSVSGNIEASVSVKVNLADLDIDYEMAGKIWITAYKKLEEKALKYENENKDIKRKYQKIVKDLQESLDVERKTRKELEIVVEQRAPRYSGEPETFKFSDVIRVVSNGKNKEENKAAAEKERCAECATAGQDTGENSDMSDM